MDEHTYTNFDLLLEPCGDHFIARVVDSPAGQASAEFQDPFQKLELENLVLRMGHGRGRARRIDTPEEAAVKIFGGRLFKAVFQEPVYTCYMRSVDQVRSRQGGLRVRLHINVPRFNDLPWEFLFDPSFRQFVALSSDTPISRYFDSGYSTQALPLELPVQVLVMLSSPAGYPELDLDEEWKHLNQALQPLIDRGQVLLHRLAKPTLKELQRYLRVEKAHILHFIGHGRYFEEKQDGTLLLEDDTGRGIPTSGEHLGAILHDHHSLRLVVLNACEGARTSSEDPYAGVAQTLVQQGIPAVLAMQFEIYEEAAQILAQQFYGALADGYPVDAALSEARKAIYASPNPVEWGTPVLFMRIPDGILFKVEKTARALETHPLQAGEEEQRKRPQKEAPDGWQAQQPIRAEAAADAKRSEQEHRQGRAPAISEAQRLEAASHLSKGLARNKSGRYGQAVAEFSRALELDPGLAQAYVGRAEAYCFRKDPQYEAAVADCSMALELEPGLVEAYINRGRASYLLGKYESAVADYSQAIRIAPQEVRAYSGRAQAYSALKNHEAEVEDLSTVIRLDPQNPDGYIQRANAYDYWQKYELAVQDYSRAIQLAPENILAYSLRAFAFEHMGRLAEAEADRKKSNKLVEDVGARARQAAEEKPRKQKQEPRVQAQAHVEAGLALFKKDKYEAAIAEFSQAIQIDPDLAAAYFQRGNAHAMSGSQVQAIADFSSCIKLNPRDALAYYNRGNSYLDTQGDPSRFKNYGLTSSTRPAYQFSRDFPPPASPQEAGCLKAIQDYSRAIEIDPGFAWAYNNRGVAYMLVRDRARAFSDFSRAIELDPRYAAAYHNRSQTYGIASRDPGQFQDHQKYQQLIGSKSIHLGLGLLPAPNK